jgi:hypothetical protein
MHTLLPAPASTITLIEAEALDYARVELDGQVIYAGPFALSDILTGRIAGMSFALLGATDAVGVWEELREFFRNAGTPLVFKRIAYASPFHQDLRAVVDGIITPAEFAAYPETIMRSTTAQDGTTPADGRRREELITQALAKLAEANEGAAATPRVHLLHALLTAVREYSRCHNGLHALGGLGLEAALSAAEEVMAAEAITEHSITIRDYKPLLAAVALR